MPRRPDRQEARKLARQMARRAEEAAPLPVPASDQCALFHEIEVVPGDGFRLRSVLVNGGPVWPAFDSQTIVRMMRRGRYVDVAVEPSGGPWDRIDQPCLWGGYAIAHFGHLIADHLTRVLEGRVQRPQDLLLFVLRPGTVASDVPGFFWDVLDWYGVARGQVRFVTRPTMVAELRCFAQAEPFASYPPGARYLGLLAENAARNGLEPAPAPVVYVGRMGMLAAAKGGAAGESYLVQVLQGLGVRVLDPGRASLHAQMAAYAGAGVLIFAEGSAVHGRQLLGHADQVVVVLNRRQGARMAQAALAVRCRELHYVEASGQVIAMGTLAAGNQAAMGLALYDLTAVFAVFARHGVDLGAVWDRVAYETAVRADAEQWLQAVIDHEGAVPFDVRMATQALRNAGVPVKIAGLD